MLAVAPEEGCALLLGQRCGTTLQLRRIWPCCNIWQPAQQRPQRFQLDPREQLLAQRWGRQRQLQVLGAAHSHPRSAAIPSATDRALCLGPTLMLIRSGLLRGDAAFRAWWLPEPDASDSEPLELALEPGARDLGE